MGVFYLLASISAGQLKCLQIKQYKTRFLVDRSLSHKPPLLDFLYKNFIFFFALLYFFLKFGKILTPFHPETFKRVLFSSVVYPQYTKNANQCKFMGETCHNSVNSWIDPPGGLVRAPPPDGYLRKKNLLAAPNPPFLLASTS